MKLEDEKDTAFLLKVVERIPNRFQCLAASQLASGMLSPQIGKLGYVLSNMAGIKRNQRLIQIEFINFLVKISEIRLT